MANKKKTPTKKLSKISMKKTKGGSFSFGSQAITGNLYKPQQPSSNITDGTSNTLQFGGGGGEG